MQSRWIVLVWLTAPASVGSILTDGGTRCHVLGIDRKSGNCAGIIIPYHHAGSNHIRDYRSRRAHPDLEYAAGNLK